MSTLSRSRDCVQRRLTTMSLLFVAAAIAMICVPVPEFNSPYYELVIMWKAMTLLFGIMFSPGAVYGLLIIVTAYFLKKDWSELEDHPAVMFPSVTAWLLSLLGVMYFALGS